MVLGGWALGGSYMNVANYMSGISAFVRESHRNTSPFHQVRTQQEVASYQPGIGLPPEYDYAVTLILDSPAF